MNRPLLRELPSRPLTAGTMLAAIGVYAASLLGSDLDRLYVGALAFEGEPWRLLTAALVHADPLHLLFNLYWLSIFGSYIERELGTLRWLALTLGSALVASSAEYGITQGGVGLSGVGYAHFGFLWVLSRRSERHRDAMDGATIRLFIVWGLFCVGADYFGIMRIGNVSHAAGLLFGALAGFTYSGAVAVRAGAFAMLAATAALSFAMATTLRPRLNLDDRDAGELCYLGYSALTSHQDRRAHRFLEKAARYPQTSPACWMNIAIARQRIGDEAGFLAAVERSDRLKDGEKLAPP